MYSKNIETGQIRNLDLNFFAIRYYTPSNKK